MQLAPERTITHEAELQPVVLPLVIEFTSSRVRQRPLAARPGGIEVAGGRLPVRAVDIEAHPDLRRRFRITLLPTFIVWQHMAELARFVGPYSRRELAGAIRRVIDPELIRVEEPPRARAQWNDFTVRLWGFMAADGAGSSEDVPMLAAGAMLAGGEDRSEDLAMLAAGAMLAGGEDRSKDLSVRVRGSVRGRSVRGRGRVDFALEDAAS